MMYRDKHLMDKYETLCNSSLIVLKRYRMQRTQELKNLKTLGKEALVIPMKGQVEVRADSLPHSETLNEKDICYLPRDTVFTIRKLTDSSEVLFAYAPAVRAYAPYVKRFSSAEPIAGGSGLYRRQIYNMITESDPANRFLGGFVKGEDGNWGGFPPHKHDGKPEVYVYYEMGKRFGVQLVLSKEKDAAYVVRDGDAVYFDKGYHPCVATPGTGMNFVWIISANPKARNLAIDFHPDYKDMPVGKTHLKLD